jgi:C-terminal processing protease CtpA/Prc
MRKGFGTELCGVMPGMEVVAVNDVPVEDAIRPLLPKSSKFVDTESKNFALRLLLAGNHVTKRKFTLRYKGVLKDYYPDQNGMHLENIHHATLVESRLIGTTGYIIINDCLYNDDLIVAFDSTMQTMMNTSSLILDFRNTPSGGNTSVAKAIIGWFINKEHFYQKHEYYADEKNTGIKRSWEEIVSPRNGKYYSKALVILCNHWTGSVGEGIVIGFDALNRPFTKIIGMQMAQLNGAVYSYELPNTKIHFGFPAERLYHINGLPREQWKPGILVDPKWNTQQHDECISLAIAWFKGPK